MDNLLFEIMKKEKRDTKYPLQGWKGRQRLIKNLNTKIL